MLSKSISVALFFVVLASMSYGYSAIETQLQDPNNAPVLSACDNIALGKVANASANSAQSGQAVDGNLGTLWNANTYAPQWIEINLGSLYSIDEIRLYIAQTPAGNTTHEVWIADSSKVYTIVETISGFTTDWQLLDRIYSPGLTSVQWIKIVTTSSPSWVAWREIEVCQTPSPIGTPTNTPTNTPTRTPTFTPTNTPTNTPTDTPTGAPTNTPTNTPTFTPTTAPTPTPFSNTPGQVTGGGVIGSNHEDVIATFGFIINYREGDSVPKGHLTYQDHKANLRLTSISFDLLVIEGNHAWFTGTGMTNDGQVVSFKVEIASLSQFGLADVFYISIPALNGYTAGGTLTGGNITIHNK